MIRKQLKRSILIDCAINNKKCYQKANEKRIQKGESVRNAL